MERAIKNTQISFGLITIPIKITTLQKDDDIKFSSVCPNCFSVISNKKWCNKCNAEVPYAELLKGFVKNNTIAKIMTQEQVKAIKMINDCGIKLVGFINDNEIPFYLYYKTYNITPQYDRKQKREIGVEQYVLFREALKLSGLSAIGKFVMRNKSYLVSIKQYQDKLFLSLLYYPHRINFAEKIEGKVSEEELNLALEFIKKITFLNFGNFYTVENVKDEYREKLMRVISGETVAEQVKEVKEEEGKSLTEQLKEMVK
jgi:DNA end-binding protein Ku